MGMSTDLSVDDPGCDDLGRRDESEADAGDELIHPVQSQNVF
jgi:hypothetical protein